MKVQGLAEERAFRRDANLRANVPVGRVPVTLGVKQFEVKSCKPWGILAAQVWASPPSLRREGEGFWVPLFLIPGELNTLPPPAQNPLIHSHNSTNHQSLHPESERER